VTEAHAASWLRTSAAHVLVADVEQPELAVEDHHHLGRVLRLRTGDEITVGDGRGAWRRARWTGTASPDPISHTVVEQRSTPPLTVAFTPTKGDRPEWVVQKLTELGIDRVIPVLTARSVVRWDAQRAARQVERWRRIACEAVCQSRQLFVPTIEPVIELAALVASEPVRFAEPGAPFPTADSSPVLVGPEGGFTPEELACATELVGLPGGVLRAETAAVAAGVLLAADRLRGAGR
jgi:16S rRNA (uracil1498-N3)-methyltransferase